MAKGRASMSIIMLIVVLVVVIALSTLIMRSVMRTSLGFEDTPAQIQSSNSLGVPPDQDPPSMNGIIPARCRSPNGNGIPCDTATFCDGTTQACVNKVVRGSNLDNVDGYFT